MTIYEIYAIIRRRDKPQAVLITRAGLSCCSVFTKQYETIKKSNLLFKCLGVYDRGVQNGWIEEDFQAWKEYYKYD